MLNAALPCRAGPDCPPAPCPHYARTLLKTGTITTDHLVLAGVAPVRDGKIVQLQTDIAKEQQTDRSRQ